MHSSSRKGLIGIRKIGECQGEYICTNPNCGRVMSGWEENKSSFKSISRNEALCKTCGMFAKKNFCGAKKLTEYSTSLQVLVVFHQGNHTCTMKNKETREMRQKREEIVMQALRSNLKAKPKQIQMSEVIFYLSKGMEKEAEDAALLLSNVKQISKIRAEYLKKLFSDDRHSFKAIRKAKKKLDKIDKYLLYQYNDKKLNPEKPTYIYKSSEDSIKLAIQMNVLDPKNQSLMKEEFLFLDTMHGRVKNMKTVTAWSYSTAARKMMCIATFECEKEDRTNITIFLELLYNSMKEFLGQDDYDWLPRGFLVDAAGANFHAIRNIFGRPGIKRTAVCQWHFKRCARENMLDKISEHYQSSFIKHVNDMCEAPTEGEYMRILTALHFICEECNALQWLDWWDARRIHLIPAYRGFSIPGLNLAEAGQSTLRVDKPNMLIDAVYMDSSSMFIQNIRFRALQQNRLDDMGRGPMQREVAEKERTRQEARGDIYLDDLLGQMNAEELKAFYSEEESSEDSLVHIQIPSAKSKHKAPKTFCSKNPTQMTRKRKSEDVQGKENKKKKSSPENTASQKAKHSKNSTIQVGEDDMNAVFNVTMSETMNLRKLENNPPRIVLINNTIIKCNGCGRNFKAEDRKEPNNMVFKINAWKTRRNDRGEKVATQPQPTYYCARDLACVRMQRKGILPEDIYCSSFYVQCLTLEHVKLLKKRGYWNHILTNRRKKEDREKQ